MRLRASFGAKTKWAAAMARCLLPILVVLCLPSISRASIVRYPVDEQELTAMRAQNPKAAETLERGETLAASGQLDQALTLFLEAQTALPDSALPRRRICEAMTALGRGLEGLSACYTALQIQRTNLAVRATVRALVDGPQAPTMGRVGEALTLLTMERRRAPNHWMLSSALCDIAERIGDGVMLQHCAEELVRLAPTAPETRRALAQLESRCPPMRFWAGWLAIAVAIFATSLHAGRRALAARKGGRAPIAVALTALLVALSSSAAAQSERPTGQWLSKWSVDDSDPENSIPTEEARGKDPLQFGYWLQDVALKGEIASKHKDYPAAVKYYRAMAKAVPDRAISFSKLCEAYEAAGDSEKAIASCGSALLVQGVKQGDYARYVHLVLARPGPINKKDEETLTGVIDNLKADPNAHPLADQLECDFAIRAGHPAQLKGCTEALVASAPDDPETIRAQFALAMQNRDLAQARQVVERAKKAGVKEEGLRLMQQDIITASNMRVWSLVLTGVAAGLLFLGLGVLVRYILNRRTTPGPVPPVAPSSDGSASTA